MIKAECKQHGHNHYRLQVHNNLFLDAENPKHFEDRYINDAKRSKFKVNARFTANYTTETDPSTGFKWVCIYATRNIKAGEEIFLNYDKDFWSNITRNAVTRNTAQTPNQNTSTTTESALLGSNDNYWEVPSPQPPPNNQSPSYTSSSSIDVWAAPTHIPGDSHHHTRQQVTPTNPFLTQDTLI